MLKSTNYFFLFILILAVFISSCKSGGLFTANKLKAEKPEELYQKTISNYIDYNTFSAKISTKLDLPEQKNSFSSNLRIKKDSIIWISVTPALGIEILRVSLTQDSVMFLNRLNSTYFSGDYKYLQRTLNLNLNYSIIQSMLLDEFFIYENNVNTKVEFADYFSDVDSSFYSFQNINKKDLKKIEKSGNAVNYLLQKFLIEPTNYKIAEVNIDEKIYKRNLTIQYSDFTEVDGKYFPEKMELNIKNGEENANISIKYSKITLNKDLKFLYNVPEKYQKFN